jgi:hypothetical protein
LLIQYTPSANVLNASERTHELHLTQQKISQQTFCEQEASQSKHLIVAQEAYGTGYKINIKSICTEDKNEQQKNRIPKCSQKQLRTTAKQIRKNCIIKIA